jgi:hypothetical protein
MLLPPRIGLLERTTRVVGNGFAQRMREGARDSARHIVMRTGLIGRHWP